MKKCIAFLLTTVILTTTFPSFVFADADVDTPEAPEIRWDDDYSNSSSSQRVRMTAEIPDGAEKMRFYLFADDDRKRKDVRVDDDDDEVSVTFSSLDEEQEVWGYVVAYDDDDEASERSEWTSEYIDKKSSYSPRVDRPEEPEIEWENAGYSTKDTQRITIHAEMPDDADELRFFLICDGSLKKSGKIDDEDYTFRSVDYDQTVIAYVKAYDDNGRESYRSPTVTMYIGGPDEVSRPRSPFMRWADEGYDSPYGQTVRMSADIPSGARRIRYYLYANGTLYQSDITDRTTHTFRYIQDNQRVTGFVKAYDKWDNESPESEYAYLQVPDRTNRPTPAWAQPSAQVQQPARAKQSEQAQPSDERIIDKQKGVSIKDFKMKPLWINAPFHFKDVSQKDRELNQALQYFYSTRLMENQFKDKFYPDYYITRMEFLKALLNIADLSELPVQDMISHYKDIDEEHPHHDEILLANYKGIMRGYSDRRFHPDNQLSYGAAARAVVNAFELRNYTSEGERQIDDIGQHYIDALVNAKIMPVKPSDQFDYITRAEAVKMLYRIVKIKMDNR